MRIRSSRSALGRVACIACAPLVACFDASETGPQLLVPEDITLHWDSAFDATEDGRVALVPVDVMVYDGTSGEPMSHVDLHFSSMVATSAVLLPQEVEPVDEEPLLGDLSASLVWDAWRDRYFDLSFSEPRERLDVQTDETGLARVYALVDAFPADSRGYLPIPFSVAMDSAGPETGASFPGLEAVGDDTFLVVAR